MTTCWIVRTGRTLSTDRSARWGWGSSSRTRLVVSAVSVKPRERLNDVIANHRQELDVQSLQGNENKGVCQKHPRKSLKASNKNLCNFFTNSGVRLNPLVLQRPPGNDPVSSWAQGWPGAQDPRDVHRSHGSLYGRPCGGGQAFAWFGAQVSR